MFDYEFYLEFDGERSIAQTYQIPQDTVVERTIDRAAKKFAKRKKMKYIDHESLAGEDGTYRVYFEKKRKEYVFFVRQKG